MTISMKLMFITLKNTRCLAFSPGTYITELQMWQDSSIDTSNWCLQKINEGDS